MNQNINQEMKMKNFTIQKGLFLLLLTVSSAIYAQDSTMKAKPQPDNKPIRSTFENQVLINNQTVMNPSKKTLDFVIEHRFGILSMSDDMYGLFAPSNIRLGLTYGLCDRLAVGIGATKDKRLYDLQAKYIALKQTKLNSIPVTVSVYGDVARSALDDKLFLNQDSVYKGSNRLSYFGELMVARKINTRLSLQAAFTFSHFNLVDSTAGVKHDNYGLSFLGRYRFSPQSSIIVEYDHPLTTRSTVAVTDYTSNSVTTTTTYYPKPNLGIGIEVATSGHQFQLFVCTANAIINQETRVYNQNDWTNREVMLGFNITRQWGF